MRGCIVALLTLALLPVAPAGAAGRWSKLFERTSPSVVVLYTFEKVPAIGKKGERIETSIEGVGSGVLISDDGKILTAAHVVHLADAVHVEFKDGTRVLGRVLATDPASDVALVRVDDIPESATVAKLGDSDPVTVGDDVYVIGAPYGIGHSLSTGVIGGRRHATDDSLLTGAEFFHTDASINQGNSGGPLFNDAGEVIGIVSYILSRSGGFEGMGFAVTINTARRLLLDQRGLWSGIEGKILTRSVAEAFNVPQERGYLVERIAQGSIADQAGIRGGAIPAKIRGKEVLLGGDIILSVAGVEVGKGLRRTLREKFAGMPSGTQIDIEVLRAGRRETLHFAMPELY